MHRGYGLVLSSIGQRLQTFWEMSRKTIVEFSRYPVAFAALFAQIFLIILMFLLAALTFADPSKASEGLGRQLAGVMIYGFVTNMFLSFVLWEIGFSIREEQARGTLESLYLSPASKFGALVSRIFAISIFTGLFCAAGVLMVNFLVGGLAFHNGGLAMVVLLLAFSGFLGIGFVFAGLSIKLKESAQFLVNGTQFFFMIFSAQFFPFAALASIHPGLLAVSRALPVSYAVDLFRSLLLGVEPELLDAPTEFLIVVAFAILSPLLGFFAYKYVERRARKDGNLGEF